MKHHSNYQDYETYKNIYREKTQALPFKCFPYDIIGYKPNDQKCEICSEAITCKINYIVINRITEVQIHKNLYTQKKKFYLSHLILMNLLFGEAGAVITACSSK